MKDLNTHFDRVIQANYNSTHNVVIDMIDTELIHDLISTYSQPNALVELSQEETDRIVAEVGRRFVDNYQSVWWWRKLKQPHTIYQYANFPSEILRRLFADCTNVVIVITDERSQPWAALTGSLEDVINAIQQTRFFEYFITTPDCNLVVFDTHDNYLVHSTS